MKLLVLISCLTFLAIAQTPVTRGDYDITANNMTTEAGVTRASGHVIIETDALVLHADTAEFDLNSKEITAHGDVRVQLK
jgi:Asp-tRNA(Asn)/Glu-tRNA(Gln) amidotransferase A subunit family amidase